MKMSESFPSKWLRHVDLKGRTVRVCIDTVVQEKVGDDIKPVVYFRDKEKGLGLNKTNANTIVKAYGDDSDGWPGKELELYPSETEYMGDTVDCIRLRAVATPGPAEPTPTPTPKPEPEQPPTPSDNDDIPF
jgi:hypothetical protein